MENENEDFLARLKQRLNESGSLEPKREYKFFEAEEKQLSKRYRKLKEIGRGSQKICWEAEDQLCERRVALLICHCREELSEQRFLQEVRLYSLLNHSAITTIFDVGRNEDGNLFYVAEFLEGESLSQYFSKGLQKDEWLSLVGQILEVMTFAHSQGVFYLDLKPDNIRITSEGAVKLTDWEMALGVDNMALSGLVRGTPGYMLPKQRQQQVDFKPAEADVYSLGVIILELIRGRKLDLQEKLLRRELNGLGAGINAIISRCLRENNPYADAQFLYKDWQTWLSGFSPQAEQAGLWRQLRLLMRRQQSLFLKLVALFLVAFTALFMFFLHEENQQTHLTLSLKHLQLEKRERVATLMKSREVIFHTIEQHFKAGEISEMNRLVQMLEPIKDQASEWNLWKARSNFRLGYQGVQDLEILRDEGNSLDLHLFNYLKSNASEKGLKDFLYNLSWEPNEQGLQYLLGVLIYENSPERRKRLMDRMKQNYPHAIRPRLFFLHEDKYSQKFTREMLEQAAFGLERFNYLTKRQDCVLAQSLAKKAGMNDLVEKFELLKPTNLALGCKAWSDGFNEKSPKMAVNGKRNNEDFWAAYNWPRTLTIDLGEQREFSRVDIYLFSNKDGRRKYAFELRIASELQQKGELIVEQKPISSTLEALVYEFEQPKRGRYLHLKMLSNNVNKSVHVREVEVYK